MIEAENTQVLEESEVTPVTMEKFKKVMKLSCGEIGSSEVLATDNTKTFVPHSIPASNTPKNADSTIFGKENNIEFVPSHNNFMEDKRNTLEKQRVATTTRTALGELSTNTTTNQRSKIAKKSSTASQSQPSKVSKTSSSQQETKAKTRIPKLSSKTQMTAESGNKYITINTSIDENAKSTQSISFVVQPELTSGDSQFEETKEEFSPSITTKSTSTTTTTMATPPQSPLKYGENWTSLSSEYTIHTHNVQETKGSKFEHLLMNYTLHKYSMYVIIQLLLIIISTFLLKKEYEFVHVAKQEVSERILSIKSKIYDFYSNNFNIAAFDGSYTDGNYLELEETVVNGDYSYFNMELGMEDFVESSLLVDEITVDDSVDINTILFEIDEQEKSVDEVTSHQNEANPQMNLPAIEVSIPIEGDVNDEFNENSEIFADNDIIIEQYTSTEDSFEVFESEPEIELSTIQSTHIHSTKAELFEEEQEPQQIQIENTMVQNQSTMKEQDSVVNTEEEDTIIEVDMNIDYTGDEEVDSHKLETLSMDSVESIESIESFESDPLSDHIDIVEVTNIVDNSDHDTTNTESNVSIAIVNESSSEINIVDSNTSEIDASKENINSESIQENVSIIEEEHELLQSIVDKETELDISTFSIEEVPQVAMTSGTETEGSAVTSGTETEDSSQTINEMNEVALVPQPSSENNMHEVPSTTSITAMQPVVATTAAAVGLGIMAGLAVHFNGNQRRGIPTMDYRESRNRYVVSHSHYMEITQDSLIDHTKKGAWTSEPQAPLSPLVRGLH